MPLFSKPSPIVGPGFEAKHKDDVVREHSLEVVETFQDHRRPHLRFGVTEFLVALRKEGQGLLGGHDPPIRNFERRSSSRFKKWPEPFLR